MPPPLAVGGKEHMDKVTPRTLSGFMELLPAPQQQMEKLLGTLRRVYALYGFTPLDTTGWEAETVHEDDTTLFVRGAGFRDFERRGLMFPVLAHA